MSHRVIRGFWSAERRFPAIRTCAWRLFCDAVAWGFPDPDLHFMNWGYVGPDVDENALGLAGFAERNRTMIQLYAHTIGTIELRDRTVVEIGSGRGGGAAWIAREKSPAAVTGVACDGGLVDNLPVSVLTESGCRFALASQIGSNTVLPAPEGELPGSWAFLFNRIFRRAKVRDIPFAITDFSRASQMMEIGKAHARTVLASWPRAGELTERR